MPNAATLSPMVEQTEAEVRADCDQLVRQLGGHVVSYSQSRPTRMTVGIPDVRYLVFDAAILFEHKRESGKLTLEQFNLLSAEYRAGGIVCCGGLDELRVLLPVVRRDRLEAAHLGWLLVRLWAARGFRTERRRS